MLFSSTPKPASFAKIRMQILSRWLLKNDLECAVVALTSRLPREGVSTVVRGLARSFSVSDAGRVLILDASKKHPRKAPVLDLTKTEHLDDLFEYITKNKKPEYDVLRVASIMHNNFHHAGMQQETDIPVPDILIGDDGTILDGLYDLEGGSKQPRKLLRKLKKNYDVILVDAGSLGNANGTFWLLNSDVNILVLDCTRTTRESLEHQQRELENSNIAISGSILNKRKFPIPNSLYWLAR